MYKALLILFIPFSTLMGQLCTGDPLPKSPCAGWEALSQIGSLMPERIWEQEFDIKVDRKAFEKAIPQWMAQARQDKILQPRYVLGCSHHYFLKATMSGEYCRLIDLYQEFEWSPFWKYPPRIAELRSLEKQILSGSQ